MTTYLEIPCPYPRCGEQKLQRPQMSGSRLYSQCAACNRKSLYIIHEKTDGSKTYSIVPIGAPNRDMVRATFWITREQATLLEEEYSNTKSQIVRSALTLYNSHTLRLIP